MVLQAIQLLFVCFFYVIVMSFLGRKLIFAAKKVKAKLSLKDIPLEHGEWTLWSDCTEGKTEKHRYRNCRETRIYKCPKETAPCTASDKSSKGNKKKSDRNTKINRQNFKLTYFYFSTPSGWFFYY